MSLQDEKKEKVQAQETALPVFCPHCSDPNPPGAVFCKKCGKQLTGKESQNKPTGTLQNQIHNAPPPPIPPTGTAEKSPPFPPVSPSRNILVTNTENIVGQEIEEVIGLVQGNTVRAKHIGKDIVAQLKNIVGGEVTDYTRLFNEAREVAISRMIQNAIQVGADAVVNVRFVSSTISQGMSELLAYGTAVRLKKEKGE